MADYKDNSNDRLEKVLAEYKKNSSLDKLTELAQILRTSTVHMPCKSDGNKRIAAMVLHTKDNLSLIPIYTNKWHMNGKLQDGTRIAMIPYLEVNKIAANEAKLNKMDGIILNPGDTNIILNMNFVNKVQSAEDKASDPDEKREYNFNIPPEPDNKGIEDQMMSFAEEHDETVKQSILNGILNSLRGAEVAVPLGKNKEGKDSTLVMTVNSTGDKFTPVYTSCAFAAKRHPECKIAIFKFDKANEIALNMRGEVDGMMIVSEKVTINLKTRLLENVKEVNDRIKEGAVKRKEAQTELNRTLSEQVKFTMTTLPELLERRGQKFVDALLDRRAAYIDELYENSYYDIRMYPYVVEEFTVTAITASPTVDAIEIEFPRKGNGEGSAIRSYIVWNNETQKGRYFGICKNADSALMIMEVTDGKQFCHGITAIESNEMSRILDIAQC